MVYLLTNPVMSGLVKIGMTTQEDIDQRMKELYTTDIPVSFECKFGIGERFSEPSFSKNNRTRNENVIEI